MIGSIRGTLVSKTPPTVVVDVQGIGYELDVPMSTCLDLPECGQAVQLMTHLVVREDSHNLYGFASEQERALFRRLLKVNRVGARLALGILSGISASDFVRCVQSEDVSRLARLPGVGRKTAERLIMDLRDQLTAAESSPTASDSGPAASSEPRHEAYTALTALGYKPVEARRMLDQTDASLRTTEDILRSVLRSAAPSRGQ